MTTSQYIAALKQERELAIQYRADKIAELEKFKEYYSDLVLAHGYDSITRLLVADSDNKIRIAEMEKEQIKSHNSRIQLIEEFAEAECMGDLAKIARNYGYEG